MQNESTAQLGKLIQLVPELLRHIRPEEWERKPHPDKWSKKQVLGHLIDSALNNHQRFIRIQYEDVPTIRYDQDNWCALNQYQELESEHLIQLWTVLNRQLLEVINRIPEEHWLRKGNTGLPEPVTLRYLVHDYITHLEHHVTQFINE